MKRITTKEFLTYKKCPICRTFISEVITIIFGNEIEYAKIHCPDTTDTFLDSYISCPECSIPFGRPGFVSKLKDISNSERDYLKWELSLFEAKLTRKITVNDIFKPENNAVPLELLVLEPGKQSTLIKAIV